ncbi:MAG: NAD(P)/FAD-dependent oxidoreductase [Pseudomonadota bacterium]
MKKFDLAVVGSGPGGYRAAVLAALRGLKVAIVEKDAWGGCCLNRGCVPKKDWYHSARLIAASGGFGQRGICGELSGDLTRAWQHQHEVVAAIRASYQDYLKRLGVVLCSGAARFADAATLAVDGARIAATNFIVATGAAPCVPPNLQRIARRVVTTDDLFAAPPPAGKRVAIIGSGVVATEFSFILAMFGLEVVWLAQHEPLASRGYSATARRMLQARLADFGVRARTASRVRSLQADENGVRLELPDGTQEHVDWVLLGTGRLPHTASLHPAQAGVALDARGFIIVNRFQQTSQPHIYAVGDVANPAMTSNHALAEAAVAVANVIAPQTRASDPGAVPDVVYSALELARIGLGEEGAEALGCEPATGFTAFETNPAALVEDDAAGFVRVVADADTGKLLGAEIAGSAAGELIHLAGIEFGSPDALARLAALPYNHPARAEEILNAIETLAARWGLKAQVFTPLRGR